MSLDIKFTSTMAPKQISVILSLAVFRVTKVITVIQMFGVPIIVTPVIVTTVVIAE